MLYSLLAFLIAVMLIQYSWLYYQARKKAERIAEKSRKIREKSVSSSCSKRKSYIVRTETGSLLKELQRMPE